MSTEYELCAGCHVELVPTPGKTYDIVQTVDSDGNERVIGHACNSYCASWWVEGANERNGHDFVGRQYFRRTPRRSWLKR